MILRSIPNRFNAYISHGDMKSGKFKPRRYTLIGCGIPDIIFDILNFLEIDSTFVKIIKPNTFFNSSYSIQINGDIQVTRLLTRGGLPLNLLAAEFASSYDLLITYDEIKYENLLRKIQCKYFTKIETAQ